MTAQAEASGIANHRLHALCPYFAMFPPAFARENILRYTKPGDLVLDGFSGRGTTLLEALLGGRRALACDINPVAYCITAAKAACPNFARILDAIDSLEEGYYRASISSLEATRLGLPRFFRRAFFSETLRQLLFLRGRLRWRSDTDERFVMALLLGHLHGESDRSEWYCSNQMPHSISTKPTYSLNYWRDRGLYAPRRDVFELLRDRAEYRLAAGAPQREGHVACCDIRNIAKRFHWARGAAAAAITSPPYLDTTRVEEDQWLRLWLLGGVPRPTYNKVSKDDRYEDAAAYWDFLQAAWRGIGPLLRPSSVVVCRLGARRTDPEKLKKSFMGSIKAVWPSAESLGRPRLTLLKNCQTAILNPDAVGCRYELDFTVWVPDPTPSQARGNASQ